MRGVFGGVEEGFYFHPRYTNNRTGTKHRAGHGVSVGLLLVDGFLMESFKQDPTSAAATAFGCLTMTASGVPGTVAGTAVTVTLNSVALAACGWRLYQAVSAENKYFADLDSGDYADADVDYQKAIHGIVGAFLDCELTLAAMAF